LQKKEFTLTKLAGSCTAIVPLDALGALSEHKGVKRFVPAKKLRLLMDVAPVMVNVPAFKTSSGLSGKGVIVGIVDTGIDPNHPAFAGRILSIWDQTLSGAGVAAGNYGLEVSGPTLTSSRDHALSAEAVGKLSEFPWIEQISLSKKRRPL
jgi:hypothetical protein